VQETWGGSPEEAAHKWDDAVEAASAEYANRMVSTLLLLLLLCACVFCAHL
jgi:hypothetical protein